MTRMHRGLTEDLVSIKPLSKPLSRLKGLSLTLVRGLVTLLIVALTFPTGTALADPGSIRDNSGWIPFDQSFFAFEVESALGTLKEVPIWDEVEQMMDNPYAIFHDPSVGANTQGFPSYRSSLPRRRSFIFRDLDGNPCAPGTAGCVEGPLPSHVVHPPNYNYMNGEEMRMLNIGFEGAGWIAPQIGDPNYPKSGQAPGLFPVPGQPGKYQWSYEFITVSPGEDRIEEDEPAIDFNSPIAPDDLTTCAVTSELGLYDVNGNAVPEGSLICGGDPGEPGYEGFGVLLSAANRSEQYSTPALPLPAGSGPGTIITQVPGFGTTNRRLFDPAGCVERNAKSPGSCSGQGYINRLLKPTLRPRPTAQPDYLQNSEANLAADPAALEPSNENDFYRGNSRAAKLVARNEAAALGKALFWDMQVGSDSVQACGSCHFHAGADNRTKNQLNPNHLGGNLVLHVGHATPNPDGSQPANQDVIASDFPFHKLANPDDHAEDVNCGLPGLPGCSQGAISDVNDVMSSMGVIFSPFTDIQPIGQWITGTFPRVVPPDIRTNGAVDPIGVFQDLRRVEPRNTPTLFATAMNFDNFWNGRARHDFNGGSVFGASDPQAHVFVNAGGTLTATRQIIRFASIASLGPGPGLSDFEMSFVGRNWAKVAKKLLQGATTGTVLDNATPLANQLVDPADSVMGIYSNQGGTSCTASLIPGIERSGSWVGASPALAPGKPGLCISYAGLIRRAFYPPLWNNTYGATAMHLNGCYTNDGNPDTPQNTPECAAPPAIPVLAANGTLNETNTHDPFDGYVLSIAPNPAAAADTNQFTQMEANFPLFWGLSIHAWVTMLVPDDSPMDRFFDANPDSFASFGESGEPGLVTDLLNCGQINPITGQPQGQPCFTPVGTFKRDPGVIAYLGRNFEGDIGTPAEAGGDRTPGSVDPLLGMDFFLGSNLSLKNRNFKSLRCGECHAGGTLTDHTFEISHQVSFNDFPNEFVTPGVELFPEPLGRSRVITGFSLEGELAENAQDAIERNVADFCTVEPCVDLYGNPIPGGVAGGFPQGQALFDNGVYNIGVRPIFEDISRGENDPFGWPVSLSRLMFKNLGGVGYSPGGDNGLNGFAQPDGGGNALPTFDPDFDPIGDPVGVSGGLFEPTGQDQQINPGFKEEPANPLLPPYLAKWANNFVVGDEMEQDEVNAGINTLFEEPMLEGLVDAMGPFNPAAVVGEVFNSAQRPKMAMWPNVNRVNTQGAFKAPPLRHVELTGPYFHNGGRLTLRQVLDFYLRGGDFPKMNAAHRDFLIMNLKLEDEALGGCVDPSIVTLPSAPCSQEGAVPEFTEEQKEEIIVAVIDFLLELTDERVAFERAPFDHPEIFVPLDGKAPDNLAGRPGFLALSDTAPVPVDCNGVLGAGPCFRQVPAVGQGGIGNHLPNFLGIASEPRLIGPEAFCDEPNNHYCH